MKIMKSRKMSGDNIALSYEANNRIVAVIVMIILMSTLNYLKAHISLF